MRIAKLNFNNPFGSGPLKQWFHIKCFCESKANQHKISISCADHIDGWDTISKEDRELAISIFGPEFKVNTDLHLPKSLTTKSTKDNLFSQFNRLIGKIASEPSYTSKSAIIEKYLREGSNGKKFDGDLETWLKLLVPKVDQRVYNLQDKQIIKLFSKIFGLKHDDLLTDLHSGDVSETIAKFFQLSKHMKQVEESNLTVQEVDNFLDELAVRTLENDQKDLFENVCKKATTDDIRTIIRLIKKDLKMNCRERHVLDAIHPDAYENFQKSRDLARIIKQYGNGIGKNLQKSSSSKLSSLQVMTPISPMLAEACKDFDKALKKCREGFYSEVKYDGERVQIHKKRSEFKFFSRNLKPVQEHKIAKIKEFLPKAFPDANDLILDSEIIMVDTISGSLLPFGTLGKHKKQELENASTCLFIFDCLYFNGDDLTKKNLKERKKFLEKNMQPIKYHIELSEYKLLTTKNELVEMTKEVLKKGLEGLVLKGVDTIYEPGKRRWLKVKKDYLLEGSIADNADLVVLGAYYGTGKMGSRFSIFLMGCYDESFNIWKTVTKVHSGLDDATMEKMHKHLEPLMESFNAKKKLPQWVQIDRTLIPDVLAKDPFKMPVFEIVAAEFTNSDVHTANSISMRFPRITKIRHDKSPKEATNLEELTHLFKESKSGIHIDELNKLKSNSQPMMNDEDNSVSTTISNVPKSSKNKTDMLKRKKEDSRNDNVLPEKKLKVHEKKSVTPEKSSKTPEKSKSGNTGNLFIDCVLFDVENLTSTEIEKFKRYGGTVTGNSLEANLVLYNEMEVQGELEDLRLKYVPTCRHYRKSWLADSLSQMKLQNPLKYFVTLKQCKI